MFFCVCVCVALWHLLNKHESVSKNFKFLCGWASLICESSANESQKYGTQQNQLFIVWQSCCGCKLHSALVILLRSDVVFFSLWTRQISPIKPEINVRGAVRNAAFHLDLYVRWNILQCVHACMHVCGWQECAGCSNWEIRSQQETHVLKDREKCDETEWSHLQPLSSNSSPESVKPKKMKSESTLPVDFIQFLLMSLASPLLAFDFQMKPF